MKKYAVPQYKQVTTPSNPDVGFNKMYFKNDDKAYKLNSAGVEEEIGGVVVGGNNITLETSIIGGDAYAIAAYAPLVDKLLIPFITDVSNIGPATLAYGLEPVKPIVNVHGTPLLDNDIQINRLIFLKYDLANDRYVLLVENITPYSPIVSTNVIYNITNGLVDRDFDADSTSIDELMDILDTLTNDLEGAGVFGSGTPTSIVQTYIANNATGIRTLDCNVTSIDELADILATLIADLSNGNMFNGGILQETNQTYTVTNLSTDRTADANSTIINELADIIGSVIEDLKNTNFIL